MNIGEIVKTVAIAVVLAVPMAVQGDGSKGNLVPIHFPPNFDAEMRHWIAVQAASRGHAIGLHDQGMTVMMDAATRTGRVQPAGRPTALFLSPKANGVWEEADFRAPGVRHWLTVVGGTNQASVFDNNAGSGPRELIRQTLGEVASMPDAKQIVFDPGIRYGAAPLWKGYMGIVPNEVVWMKWDGESAFHPSIAASEQLLVPSGEMVELRFPSVNGQLSETHSELIRRMAEGELKPSSPELSQFVRPTGSATRRNLVNLVATIQDAPVARFGTLLGAGFAVDWAVYKGTYAASGSETWAQIVSTTSGVATGAAVEHFLFGTAWTEAFGASGSGLASGRLSAAGTSVAGLASVVFLGVQLDLMAYEVNRGIYGRINSPDFNGFTPQERDAWLAHPSSGWQYVGDAIRGYGRAIKYAYGFGGYED